jgi:hypothetical protein
MIEASLKGPARGFGDLVLVGALTDPLLFVVGLDRRLVAGLPLEAHRGGPGFEHLLQQSEVLGVDGDCQRLSDLLDAPLLVGGTHLSGPLEGVGGQLEVVAVDPRGHAPVLPPATPKWMSCPSNPGPRLGREHIWSTG